MRTWALSAGLSLVAACSAVQVDPFVVQVGELSENQRRKVEHVLEDVAALVPLEAEQVKSRLEIYEFLLDEMPFTGGVVRELGRGKWAIARDPKDPAAFTVADPEGYRLRFELLRKEANRRIYVTTGVFQMGILPPLEGSTLIVVRMVPEGAGIRTDAMVYVRVETPFYAQLAKGLRGVVEDKVRERSGFFIRSARWVAEEAASRPDWLVMQGDGSREVDQAVLAEFRHRFLRP
ncbi:MAG TPA: hypothetical protein VG457_16675 [Planctomycetota bacterium]|nr:hypothetical protein [Planctomycetota bacterium]